MPGIAPLAAGRIRPPISPGVIGSGSTLPRLGLTRTTVLPRRGRNAAGFWISTRPGRWRTGGDTFSFGFSSAGEAMRALTTLATKHSVSGKWLTT